MLGIPPLVLVLVVVVAACGPGQPAADGRAEVVAQYAALVHTRYEDAVSQATALEAKVKAFVQAPGAQTLEDAKQAWLSARPSRPRAWNAFAVFASSWGIFSASLRAGTRTETVG